MSAVLVNVIGTVGAVAALIALPFAVRESLHNQHHPERVEHHDAGLIPPLTIEKESNR